MKVTLYKPEADPYSQTDIEELRKRVRDAKRRKSQEREKIEEIVGRVIVNKKKNDFRPKENKGFDVWDDFGCIKRELLVCEEDEEEVFEKQSVGFYENTGSRIERRSIDNDTPLDSSNFWKYYEGSDQPINVPNSKTTKITKNEFIQFLERQATKKIEEKPVQKKRISHKSFSRFLERNNRVAESKEQKLDKLRKSLDSVPSSPSLTKKPLKASQSVISPVMNCVIRELNMNADKLSHNDPECTFSPTKVSKSINDLPKSSPTSKHNSAMSTPTKETKTDSKMTTFKASPVPEQTTEIRHYLELSKDI